MRLHLFSVCGKEGCAYVKLSGNRYDCDPQSRVTQYTLADGYPLLLFIPLCVLVPPLEVHTLYFYFCYTVIRKLCQCNIELYLRNVDTSLYHHDCALAVSFLCCMLSILCTMTYPVALVEIDVMISPLRIRFVFIFKKYPTPCRRCFVILMLLLLFSLFSPSCVIIFV